MNDATGAPIENLTPQQVSSLLNAHKAIADCFILTFRGVARAVKMEWVRLECAVEGTLERRDGVSRFTHFTTRASLSLRPGADEVSARALLERAERGCLVANSLSGERHLEVEIRIEHASAYPATSDDRRDA